MTIENGHLAATYAVRPTLQRPLSRPDGGNVVDSRLFGAVSLPTW